jgi:hypothetical protein
MTKRNINRYLKSRWDARFLINTIMGLLETQRGPYADVVLAVVTAAIRSYSRACSGKMNKSQEEGIYEALKDYAKERALCKGTDSERMECFIALMDWVDSESEVWAFDLGNENIEKASGSFPMDCLNEEQIDIVTNQSWERFHAKFYTSDGPPEKGLQVDLIETYAPDMDSSGPIILIIIFFPFLPVIGTARYTCNQCSMNPSIYIPKGRSLWQWHNFVI